MLDIKFIRENADIVRENIKKKFQDQKLPLVDEVIRLDAKYRKNKGDLDTLRSSRNAMSKDVGALMRGGEKAKAEALKEEVRNLNERILLIEASLPESEKQIRDLLLAIPQLISSETPLGRDDSENVEITKYGEPAVPDFEVPYHVDILESFDGIDIDSARKTTGNGFYYLKGDVARIHSGLLSFARDFMIDRGFTYYIPPFMIRGEVVDGVMSFGDKNAMAYKIEGEDLYLIGTSEHSMIGMFIDRIIPENELPKALTSYSPCFRKEVGAHGIEERGLYRVHQFEKQEMTVVCKPEESPLWYDRLWQNTVDFFRALDIPVRTLECCSGDLADIKVRSCDVEAWSPRQKKYFEVGSCSNIGDAQARRLGIRVRSAEDKNYKYLPHTLNNTVVAPPRMLIAFFENNLQSDGSVRIPEALRPYIGGKDMLLPKK
jgi:seryl-tRNA synthetase